MKKLKKVIRPNPFGHPQCPSFDFYINNGTVQVCPIRGYAALYLKDFKAFQKWLDKVQHYADYKQGKLL